MRRGKRQPEPIGPRNHVPVGSSAEEGLHELAGRLAAVPGGGTGSRGRSALHVVGVENIGIQCAGELDIVLARKLPLDASRSSSATLWKPTVLVTTIRLFPGACTIRFLRVVIALRRLRTQQYRPVGRLQRSRVSGVAP